jgi:hypothetical protein
VRAFPQAARRQAVAAISWVMLSANDTIELLPERTSPYQNRMKSSVHPA